MKNIITFLLIVLAGGMLNAQTPIGSFRAHLPYRSFHSVAVTSDYIYAATNKSLMLLNKADRGLSSWSKVDGLSEIGIARIYYSKENDVLIIAYTNSNIDFIKNDKLTNVADIKNKQMIGSKSINNIYVNGNIAYLSCAFGVVLINLQNFTIQDTWFTTRNDEIYEVEDFTISNNKYYLSTPKGIFDIETDNIRVMDFAEWHFEDELGENDFNMIQSFHDRLYANKNGNIVLEDSIFVMKGGEWQYDSTIYSRFVRSIDANENELLVCDWNCVHVYDTNETHVYYGSWNDGTLLEQARQAVFDGKDEMWVADDYLGLIYLNRPYTYSGKYTDNGPYSEMVESMDCSGGVLAVVPGTRSGWGISYFPPFVSYFADETWNYNIYDFTSLPDVHDLTKVVVNPRDLTEFYIGSWGAGLFRFKDGHVAQHFTTENSPLQSPNTSIFVSGLCYDNNNNLWMTNSQTPYPLKVIKSDGTWASFSLSPYITSTSGVVAEHVVVDPNNFKWISFPRSNQLIVYTDNNTIGNSSDDQVRSIDLNSYANVQTSTISCLAADIDGDEIWIGTEQGIKVVYNSSYTFSNTVYAQNILVEQSIPTDDTVYVQNLLEFESVTAIAVDGANRKWIGTSKAGVFLVSEDGTKELLHFTEDNSPLFSNQITSIAINHENGEVFIGTTNGIISYRGTATESKENFDEALVFPNPVRETYTGVIAVSGLMEDSFCKITDASGKLVWQGYANGGELIWDGKDFYGKRPATGVYFVFASDKTGKEKKVAKILFIN
jgi:hypothetical protein